MSACRYYDRCAVMANGHGLGIIPRGACNERFTVRQSRGTVCGAVRRVGVPAASGFGRFYGRRSWSPTCHCFPIDEDEADGAELPVPIVISAHQIPPAFCDTFATADRAI